LILAGDIGGTKTVIALFERTSEGVAPQADRTFPSADYDSLEQIVALFLEDHRSARVDAACFGVAGAVIDHRSRTTNLPWLLEEDALARACGSPRAKLLNDLEAAAYGMLHLGPDERLILNPGSRVPRRGNVAVIAAGTGLGEALLIWDGQQHQPVATEGGHASFAPTNEREDALLEFLRRELGGHVSGERVLSGPGLHNVYRFLRSTSGEPEPDWLKERMQHEDPGAVVSTVALDGKDPVCADALEMFVSLYGAEAANLALKCLAVGGVFVGGGIAPKILPALRSGAFMRAFTDKGRFSDLLRSVEVSVALNPRAPLLGAAHYAARIA
jgi:glucokinase